MFPDFSSFPSWDPSSGNRVDTVRTAAFGSLFTSWKTIPTSGAADQVTQERPPLRPFADSRVGIDVPGPGQNDQTAAPGPREELAARKRREWIVGARHHDAREWEARERHGAEAAHLVGGVGCRVHVGGRHEQGAPGAD